MDKKISAIGNCKLEQYGDFPVREVYYKAMLGVLKPRIIPYLENIFEIKEILGLAEIVSAGENQLHHVIRMLELAASIPDSILEILKVDRNDLIEGVLFHDVGKGLEVDDMVFDPAAVKKGRAPLFLCHYPGISWADWYIPFHDHVGVSYQIARRYNQSEEVLEAVVLHHHARIRPRALQLVGDALNLSSVVRMDIYHYKPEQYAAPGSNLAQVITILDQLCAIERKFRGVAGASIDPLQIEYEVVRDLVIGNTDEDDPRLKLLGVTLTGRETVIFFDLRAFGSYVKMHTEYEVQSTKASILQLIRSLVRVNRSGKERDLVALIGGDEYVVVTKVTDPEIIEEMIKRISTVVKLRMGFQMRTGYAMGNSIAVNFHNARIQAELLKEHRFLGE